MSIYSVADARNNLPKLIDSALNGEEVVITRRGKPVVEIRPTLDRPVVPTVEARQAAHDRLREQRLSRPRLGISSVQLLNDMYEEE